MAVGVRSADEIAREVFGPDDARTPEERSAEEKDALQKREISQLYLGKLMGEPQFREWLFGVLEGFATFDAPFGVSPNGFPDRSVEQFKLGMRAAGWHLWTIFDDVAPDLASLMRRTRGQE